MQSDILILLLIVCIGFGHVINGLDEESWRGRDGIDNTIDIPEHRQLLHRTKRGWGSLLVTGTSILVKITTQGLTLAAAVSEGCTFYQSICDDKDEIERLTNAIDLLASQYKQEYAIAKQAYFDLKTATTNNGYIYFYIDRIIKVIENIQGIEENLISVMETKLVPSAFTNKRAFEEFINKVLGQMEYTLTDISHMVSAHEPTVLFKVAVQYLVEATLDRFSKRIQNAYGMITDNNIKLSTNNTLINLITDSNNGRKRKRAIDHTFRLVPKAFSQMAGNWGVNVVRFGSNVRNWGSINNWQGFKSKFYNKLRLQTTSLSNVKHFVDSPIIRTKFSNNFKLTWSSGIMTGIGTLGDVIQQLLKVKEWSKVATEIKQVREKYQQYLTYLNSNITELRINKNEIDQKLAKNIDIFKSVTLSFKTGIVNASENDNFTSIVGFANLSDEPLSTLDYSHTTKPSLSSNQMSMIDLLQEGDTNLTVIQDEMAARLIVFNSSLTKSANSESVENILADVINILQFSPSNTIKNFENTISLKKIVCTIAIVRPNIDDYDYFSLETFRPNCQVNDQDFKQLTTEAMVKRKSKLMRQIVFKTVTGSAEKSLSRLVDNVHNAYSVLKDRNMKEFGVSITGKDIVCMIANEFPSKSSYDYIDIDPFRPNCSAITALDYSNLTMEANRLRQLSNSITTSLKTCQDYNVCPCLSQIALLNKVPIENIETVLKQIDPNWNPNPTAMYCGATGCACRHL